MNKPTHKQCTMKYWKAFKLKKNTFNIREKHTHMHPNTRSLSLRFKLKYWFETISYGLHLSNCKIKCYENGVCKYYVFHIQTDFNVFHCVLPNSNIVLTCFFLSFFFALLNFAVFFRIIPLDSTVLFVSFSAIKVELGSYFQWGKYVKIGLIKIAIDSGFFVFVDVMKFTQWKFSI